MFDPLNFDRRRPSRLERIWELVKDLWALAVILAIVLAISAAIYSAIQMRTQRVESRGDRPARMHMQQ